jgi:hypothetical protein
MSASPGFAVVYNFHMLLGLHYFAGPCNVGQSWAADLGRRPVDRVLQSNVHVLSQGSTYLFD